MQYQYQIIKLEEQSQGKLQINITDENSKKTICEKEIVEDRKIVLARELTKIHEEYIRGNIDEIIQKSEILKGEMIILIEGAKKQEEQCSLNNLSLEEHYKYYENLGLEKKEIIKKVSKDRGVNKNEIYMHFTKNK